MIRGGAIVEMVNCRGERILLEKAIQTYDKSCHLNCYMHDTCSVLFEAEKAGKEGEKNVVSRENRTCGRRAT